MLPLYVLNNVIGLIKTLKTLKTLRKKNKGLNDTELHCHSYYY